MLQTGSQVTLQDPQTGLWNQEGIVTKVREDKLSYVVQVGNRLFVRSRKMVKLSSSNYTGKRLHSSVTSYSYSSQHILHPSHQPTRSSSTQQLPQHPQQPASSPTTKQPQLLHQTTATIMGNWFSSKPEIEAKGAITQTGLSLIHI